MAPIIPLSTLPVWLQQKPDGLWQDGGNCFLQTSPGGFSTACATLTEADQSIPWHSACGSGSGECVILIPTNKWD